MNVLVDEWIKKAEGDRRTAKRESEVLTAPNWDAVCFHAQQAVEKYLKALLQQEEVPFTKTHDLAQLLRGLLSKFPDLEVLSEDLEWLTIFAVEIRYPGESSLKGDAERAVSVMETALPLIQGKLP